MIILAVIFSDRMHVRMRFRNICDIMQNNMILYILCFNIAIIIKEKIKSFSLVRVTYWFIRRAIIGAKRDIIEQCECSNLFMPKLTYCDSTQHEIPLKTPPYHHALRVGCRWQLHYVILKKSQVQMP